MASNATPAPNERRSQPAPSGHLGWARLVALAVSVGFGVALVWANIPSWNLEDMDAYWNAGQRLREGLPLYPAIADPGAADVFRYSPWFAWLWHPLTYLPKTAVQIGWSAVLLVSLPFTLFPVLRHRSVAAVCLAALLGGFLFKTASTGNVHALLVAGLVYGVPRRSGPIWIGVAASLKIAPVAYALVYAGRREWGRAALSVAVAGILFAPALLYDLSRYPTDPGESLSLLSLAGPVPWAAVAVLVAVAAFALARTRLAWGAASVAVLSLTARLELYSLTYLLIGLDARPRRPGAVPPIEPRP